MPVRIMSALVDFWDWNGHTIGMSQSQLSRRLEVGLTTAHRYLQGLIEDELVEKIPSTYEWKPTEKGRVWLKRKVDSPSRER